MKEFHKAGRMNEFHNPGHETLARRALDRTRLLDGENPDSLQVEDAVHWSAVYAELIDFKQILLGQMRKSLQQLPVEAASEIRTVDMAIIRKQLERYEACRAFWEQRRENLVREAGDADGRVKAASSAVVPLKK